MSDPTREEYDAKLEAMEARTEAGFARLEAQLARLPTGSDLRAVKANVWWAAATVVATVIGIFSLWAVGFDSGIQITTTSVQEAIGAKDTADQNAENIDELSRKVDALINIIQNRVVPNDDS